MIYLEQGLNDVILTLTENCVLSDPYFLFKFENIMTEDVVIFSTDNISDNKLRYDHFQITISPTGATGGTGSLNMEVGQWDYTILEGTQSSLDINDFSNIVETGKLVVDTPYTYQEMGYTSSIYL